MLTRKQKKEWPNNPVTAALRELVEKEYKAIEEAPIADSLIRGEPELTQENLIENACMEHCWGTFLECLEGNWEYLEEVHGSNEVEAEDSE